MPRISELLLVTTVPYLVLAANDWPLGVSDGGNPRRGRVCGWLGERVELHGRPGHRRSDGPERPPRFTEPTGQSRSSSGVRVRVRVRVRARTGSGCCRRDTCADQPAVASLTLGAIVFYVVVNTIGLRHRTSANTWSGAPQVALPLSSAGLLSATTSVCQRSCCSLSPWPDPAAHLALAMRFRKDNARVGAPDAASRGNLPAGHPADGRVWVIHRRCLDPDGAGLPH